MAQQVRTILRLGLPGGFTMFFEIALFSLAVVMVGWLGADRLAAHQIAINMASITYMMATGISAAGAIRVGMAVGLGSPERIMRSGLAAFTLSIGMMGLFKSPTNSLLTLQTACKYCMSACTFSNSFFSTASNLKYPFPDIL